VSEGLNMALARRQFVATCCTIVTAACVPPPKSAGPAAISERAVTIPTPDGVAQAALLHPGSGSWPAVLLWPDIRALRPAFRDLGRMLAAAGYTVLVPNAFYRSAALDGSVSPGVLSPEQVRERMDAWRAAASDEGIARDARAYMAWLDAQPQTDTRRKAATLGYDVGGAHAFRAAAAMPERFGAVASIHGLGVATARPNSPHLLVGRTRAAYFVAMAQPDDAREPGDKDDLAKAFADAGLPGRVQVFPANHGFAVPDDPAYDQMSADAVWAEILALFAGAQTDGGRT
jgi:carboxymethylenebutenolidase